MDKIGATNRDEQVTRYCWRVSIAFLFFCVLAAPLQFHTEWYARLSAHEAGWLGASLKTAALYFYAFTLSVEAFLRLEQHPTLIASDLRITLLKYFLLVPVLVFFFEYFVSPKYRSDSQIEGLSQYLQIGAALTALLLSSLSHYVVIKFEARRIV